METIEERAREFVDSISATNTLTSVLEVYKHSATDQREIDIKKACEWIVQNTYNFFYCNADDLLKFVIEFKKAMEVE